MEIKKIQTAFISVYNKTGIDNLLNVLAENQVNIISTGGTYDYIQKLGYKAIKVEDITHFPAMLGGRVKTLHPNVFGGILARREHAPDLDDMQKFGIQAIDMVVVDLYPFTETVASGCSYQEAVEKIDIGGISLIRAAAKNHNDVLIVPHAGEYDKVASHLRENKCETDFRFRQQYAVQAFSVSSGYDAAIASYFSGKSDDALFMHISGAQTLRYGENPHQQGSFYGDLDALFTQLQGKELSYNNLLDIDAALQLINEFSEPTVAILKHNNACGLASRKKLVDAWKDALAGDPVSAFGGVIVTNREIDTETAEEMNKLFFEVVMAPGYEKEAYEILSSKKNRPILKLKEVSLPKYRYRTVLNGLLCQNSDDCTETAEGMKNVTEKAPDSQQTDDLIFANKIVKHSRSNAIVLAKNAQMLGSGMGQTSRVDALKHAIERAKDFDLNGAVLASDAFFPFSDCVEISAEAGIKAIVQPGGSIRDKDSIDRANALGIAMVFTGKRHFRH